MTIRVLFLHQLEAGPNTLKHKYLELSFDTICPELHSAAWMTRLRVLLGVLLALLLALWAAIWTVWGIFFVHTFRVWVPIVATVVVLLCLVALFFLLKRVFLWCMLRDAVREADEAFEKFEPDIIVGQSFGCVVALHMKRSRKSPLLLLSPANHLFHRHAGISQAPDLSPFPAITIVQGDGDETVPGADFICLASSAKHCERKVLFKEDHRLGSLGQFELREYVHNTLFKVDPELVNSDQWAVLPPGGVDRRSLRRPSQQGSARELRQSRLRREDKDGEMPEAALEGSGSAEY